MYNLVKMRIYIINLSLLFGWKLDSIPDLVREILQLTVDQIQYK